MIPLEKKLDRLIQIYATQQRSYISNIPATVGHHWVHRSCKLLRWDIKNIIPLTEEEHRQVHCGKLLIEIKNPFRYQYLINMKSKNFKDYLLEKAITEEEFINEKYKELLTIISQ